MASIKKRPDGVWRARYRDDAGKEYSRHFRRKVDAQDWLDEVTTAIVTGQYVDPRAGKETFAEFFGRWSVRQVWVSGTARSMKLSADSVEFGDVALKSLRLSHFESWVKGMNARGLEASTIHTRFRNVHAVVKAAMRDRLIAVDPTMGIALPRLRRSAAAMTLPTTVQVRALLANAADGFRPIIALAAFAGLRNAEIRALQLGDVNWLKRTIDVRRQAQAKEIRAPKYSSERQVYAPDALLRELAEHVAEHKIAGATAWLFPGRAGAPMPDSGLNRAWRATVATAKVSGIKLHDLRHFFASGLISKGCDVVTVQRALGHSEPSTTLNIYSHLWPSAEDRTRRAAEELFSAVLAADSLRTAEGV